MPHYDKAAVRHFLDAETLAANNCIDSAAHLIGFAAECAIKQCIVELRPALRAPHLHFPQLIEAAKRLVHGRNTHPMFTIMQNAKFMAGWRVDHRYEDDGTITAQEYSGWRNDASRALGAAQLRRK